MRPCGYARLAASFGRFVSYSIIFSSPLSPAPESLPCEEVKLTTSRYRSNIEDRVSDLTCSGTSNTRLSTLLCSRCSRPAGRSWNLTVTHTHTQSLQPRFPRMPPRGW